MDLLYKVDTSCCRYLEHFCAFCKCLDEECSILSVLGNVLLVRSPEILTRQNVQGQNENKKPEKKERKKTEVLWQLSNSLA